jgi:hypothetical protein
VSSAGHVYRKAEDRARAIADSPAKKKNAIQIRLSVITSLEGQQAKTAEKFAASSEGSEDATDSKASASSSSMMILRPFYWSSASTSFLR